MFDRKKYMEKYYQENKERMLVNHNQWQKKNPKYQKDWQKENKKYMKKYHKQWHIKNREKEIERIKKWQINNPKKVKEISIRHTNKRIRNLEFEPLNESFKNSEAHHINRINIVYIPKIIHRSIRHCLETGRNMEKINKLAMAWLSYCKL